MKNIIVFILFLLLCTQPVPVNAAKVNPENLRDLIVSGLESNLGLQVDFLEVANSSEDIVIEESVFDSTLFASTAYNHSVTPTGLSFDLLKAEKFSGQAGISRLFETGLTASLSLSSEWLSDNDSSYGLDPRYRTALFLDLNQPLLRDLGSSVNMTQLQISRNQQRQKSLSYLLRAQNLILQLEAVSRQLGAKTEIIQLHQVALSLANDLYLANQKKFSAGVIPISEVQEAETAMAARQLSLSLAIQERNVLQEELNRQLNHSLSNDFDPRCLVDFAPAIKTTGQPDLNQRLESAQQKRLELKISDYTVQSSSLQHNYLHNQLKPRLDLQFQLGINGLSGNERSSAPENQYSGNWRHSFISMTEVDGYEWRAGLGFSMPVGNRAAKSRYLQSGLQLKQEHYRLRDLRAAIKKEVLQQQINISSSQEQLQISNRFEALAEKSFKQEQLRLNEGLSDTFRMIFFQQKMVAAKIDRINAITRYHLALAQMDFASGAIFERHNIILMNKAKELNLENI